MTRCLHTALVVGILMSSARGSAQEWELPDMWEEADGTPYSLLRSDQMVALTDRDTPNIHIAIHDDGACLRVFDDDGPAGPNPGKEIHRCRATETANEITVTYPNPGGIGGTTTLRFHPFQFHFDPKRFNDVERKAAQGYRPLTKPKSLIVDPDGSDVRVISERLLDD